MDCRKKPSSPALPGGSLWFLAHSFCTLLQFRLEPDARPAHLEDTIDDINIIQSSDDFQIEWVGGHRPLLIQTPRLYLLIEIPTCTEVEYH